MTDKKIYFQSSLPRAGSTLLQNILGQNPKFYVTPTSGVLELIYASREQYSTSPEFKAQDKDLMRTGFLSFCKQGMQGFYNAITDKEVVIDKSRGWGVHYDFLSTVVDNPKVICIIRDPRAIYASMEKNFRKNPEQSKGIVNWAKGENIDIQSRVQGWINGIPVGLAFNRLRESINRGFAKNFLFIKYEELLEFPDEVMKAVYNYLGEEYYQHDFENIEQITQEDDEVYGHYGDHKIQSKLINSKPDYKTILGSDVCNHIINTHKWFYNTFNYKL